MASKRSAILNKLKTVIEDNVSSVKSVEVERVVPVDIEVTPTPAVFIYSGNESVVSRGSRTFGAIGKETWEWEIHIEVWGISSDMEQLLVDIHSAIMSNYTLGGLAAYTRRISVVHDIIEPTKDLKAMILTYAVVYTYNLGDMSV
jgi:hypothetical protein